MSTSSMRCRRAARAARPAPRAERGLADPVLAHPIFRVRSLCRLSVALLVLAAAPSGAAPRAGYSTFEAGQIAGHRSSSTSPALLLVGGGDWHEDAMRWFAEKAGQGHV